MVKNVFSLAALVAVLAAFVSTSEANMAEGSLRQRIAQSLESQLALSAQGIENCENKCSNAFNRFAYQISAATDRRTFEFRACVDGCNRCTSDRENNAPAGSCFQYCKNRDWHADGVVKGVIEPDKACIGGCVINTCQAICTGGTTQSQITPANKKFFYPNGGCSIKTESYSQNLEYVPWNSPNTGQGGSEDAAACCANALSLCEYVGNRESQNYIQLLATTGGSCRSFVPSQTRDAMCAWFGNPQNCGSTAPIV
jgi:hypothetical protein